MNDNNKTRKRSVFDSEAEDELRKYFKNLTEIFYSSNKKNLPDVRFNHVECELNLNASFSSEYKIIYEKERGFDESKNKLEEKIACVDFLEKKKNSVDSLNEKTRSEFEGNMRVDLRLFWSKRIFLRLGHYSLNTLYYKERCGICREGVRTCWFCKEGKVNCAECDGSKKMKCFSCSGTGEEKCRVCYGKGKTSEINLVDGPCYSCNQKGYGSCLSCSGRGTVVDYDYNSNRIMATCSNCYGQGATPCISCNGLGKISTYKTEYVNCSECNGSRHKSCSECYGVGKRSCLHCNELGIVSCGKCLGTQSLTCDQCLGQKDLIFSGKFSYFFQNDDFSLVGKSNNINISQNLINDLSSLNAGQLSDRLSDLGCSVSSSTVVFSDSEPSFVLSQSIRLPLIEIEVPLSVPTPKVYCFDTNGGPLYGVVNFINFQINECLNKLPINKIEGILKSKGLGKGVEKISKEIPFFGRVMSLPDYFNPDVELKEVIKVLGPVFDSMDAATYQSLKVQRDFFISYKKSRPSGTSKYSLNYLVFLVIVLIVFFTLF